MATQEEMKKRIIAAAQSGDVDTLQDCINKGAEVNCQDVDYNGDTPLHFAAMNGKTEVVDCLLKLGASLSVVDNGGRTPLQTAAVYSRTAVVDLLLNAGASLSVVDNEGRTPLHTAVVYGRTDVVCLLLKSGASLSVVDNEGWTPLHTAVRNYNTAVVDLLLKAGASLYVVDTQGKTPYDVAHGGAKYLLQKYMDKVYTMDMSCNTNEIVDCIVEFDYDAEQPDELTIKTGQIIKNVMTEDGGWWEGELNGKKGMFPDNFVKISEKTWKDKPHATVEKKDDTKKDLKRAQRSSVKDLASKIKDGIPVAGSQKKKESHQSVIKRAKVLYSYEPNNDDELKLNVDDVVDVFKQKEEGWWEGSLNDTTGVFPSNYVQVVEELELNVKTEHIPVDCIVEFDYDAEQPDEFTIKTGQIIKNVITEDGGWWEGELDGKKGMFPDNFVKIIEKTPKDKPHATVEKKDDTKKDLKTVQRSSVKDLASRNKDGIPVAGSQKKKESHQSMIKRAKVLYSYEPNNDDELKLDVDDVVYVFKQEEDGWWEGSLNDKTGMFPSNFVQVVEELEHSVKTELAKRLCAQTQPMSVGHG